MHEPSLRTLLLLAACALALVGCKTPFAQGPLVQPDPTVGAEDQRLAQARAVAIHGIPSPTPQLDTLADLVRRTTARLELSALFAADGPPQLSDAAGARRLREGDRVMVTVVSHPEFSGAASVGPDGWLELESVGVVRGTGLLPQELADKVRRLLEENFLQSRPGVTVKVLERAPRSVQVVGRVGAHEAREGRLAAMATVVPLPPARPLSLHELLNSVQGLAPDADDEHLVLVRRATAEEGGARERLCYHFSYRELAEAHLAGRPVWVEPEDQLVVPRLPDAFVFGAVTTPGRVPLRPGTTIAALLDQAGGVIEPADREGILAIDGGEEQVVDLDTVVRPGQVVFVPSSERVYVVGPGALRNGPLILPPGGLSAIEAVSEAGWFTPLADLGGVQILRRQGGRRVRIAVPVEDVLEGRAQEAGYQLRPGDTVYVPESMW